MESATESRSPASIGAVARLAGVTVRTLHHYDDIGLLSPSGRSRAGYRRYDDGDIERGQGERHWYRKCPERERSHPSVLLTNR